MIQCERCQHKRPRLNDDDYRANFDDERYDNRSIDYKDMTLLNKA